MAPPANQDGFLLFMQGRVAQLRIEHEDLVEREALCRKFGYIASADALKARVHVAFRELHDASSKLASYMSKKQRGFHAKP